MRQKKYFVTYNSNKNYDLSNRHLINLIKHSNLFDGVFNLNPGDLSTKFTSKYKEIFKYKRGGGYWIWKLEIISSLFESMNENDLLVYMDSGSTFNYRGENRFHEYCELISSSSYGMLNFSQNFIEREWTINEIFQYFNVGQDSKIAKAPQIEGGILLFKKNSHSLNIVNEFKNVINFDPYLITDKYNSNQKESYFIENRHDQSILSVLSKIYGSIDLGNETNFKNKESYQFSYPFLMTRHRNQNNLFKIIYYLNLKQSSTCPRYFLPNDLKRSEKFWKKYFYFNYQ